METIKMSVIIPCYNGWQYMARCLESLEKQTVLPHEVVIVDDCSTDDSYECLKKYAESSRLNIVLTRNEKNSGPGASRKNAIAKADGDYVVFCDCDDWYELEYIELMTEQIRRESADIVVCDNYNTYDDRKVVCGCVKPLIDAGKKEILALYYTSLCRLAVKKNLFEGIDMPAIYHGEDAAVVPQIMAKTDKISILDKPLYNYYFREGSASQRPSKNVYLEFLDAFKTIEVIAPRYKEECEFIGIKLVCYAASLNAFKGGVSAKIVSSFLAEFAKKYPLWTENPYLNNYDRIKKLYVKLISKRMFAACRILALLHYWVVKYKKK